MPVTLDPDAAAVFKAFQEAGRPAYETLSPAEAREFLSGRPCRLQSRAARACIGHNRLSIPAPHGAIPARVYTPEESRERPTASRRCWCSITAAAG